MTASVRQEVNADDTGGSGVTVTTGAFGSACLLGSTIELWLTCTGNSTPPGTITDSASQVYSLKSTAFDSGAGNQALLLYVLQNNASATALTFHATYGSAQTGKGLWAKELTGVAAASYDNTTTAISIFAGTGTNAITTSAITPSIAPCLCSSLVVEILSGDGSGISAGTGYSLGTTGWTFGGANPLGKSQSKLLATAVSTAATATDALNSTFAIGLGMYDQFVTLPIAPTSGPVLLGGQTAGRILGSIIRPPTS